MKHIFFTITISMLIINQFICFDYMKVKLPPVFPFGQTTYNQNYSKMAQLSNNNFAVVWSTQTATSIAAGGGYIEIHCNVYNPDTLSPLLNEIVVSIPSS